MMDYVAAIVVALLLLSGALFALVAAIGIVRLPDLYTRMHAASKAGTVGSGLLLFAAGIEIGGNRGICTCACWIRVFYTDGAARRPSAGQGGTQDRLSSFAAFGAGRSS